MTLKYVVGKRKTRHEAWQRPDETFEDLVIRARREYNEKVGELPESDKPAAEQYELSDKFFRKNTPASEHTKRKGAHGQSDGRWTYLNPDAVKYIRDIPYDSSDLIGTTFFK